MDDATLTRRAYAAYFRSGGSDQPNRASGVQDAGGHAYVVLRTGHRMLAVYRVRNDGVLKGLKRWPRELENS